MEDSATLENDTSAISGLREAVHNVLPFSYVQVSRPCCLLETKALNPQMFNLLPGEWIGVWLASTKWGFIPKILFTEQGGPKLQVSIFLGTVY
jgi:hypothetical protein